MFDYLKGQVISCELTHLTLLCGSVGFGVDVPLDISAEVNRQISTLDKSKEKKETKNPELELWVHTHISQDNFRLFGFQNQADRFLFRKIISISGIGPKLGITILSSISSNDFKSIVLNKDTKSLVGIPGIGKKTAERLVLELSDKLEAPSNSKGTSKTQAMPGSSSVQSDLEAALIDLGFKKPTAIKAVAKICKDQSVQELQDQDFSSLVKEALKQATKV